MKKFKNQIKELVPSIDFWWFFVRADLMGLVKQSKELLDWAMYYLLPAVYWCNQMKNTRNPTLRNENKKAWEKSLASFHGHALTGRLSEDELLFWQNWIKMFRCYAASGGGSDPELRNEMKNVYEKYCSNRYRLLGKKSCP